MEDNGKYDAFRKALNEFAAGQVTFLIRLNAGQVRAIPEAVKDKILDWACELEQRGVRGDDMTYIEREKQLAHTVNHFHIINSQVGQLTNSGNNYGG